MNAKQTIHFPADYALMTKEELAGTTGGTTGGTAAETAAKAVVAVGGAAILLVAGSLAARGILSIFGGKGGLASVIEASVRAGQEFIEGALSSGQDFLNALMGR